MFVLYIEVYVIDKTWCEPESNQTTDYAANRGLITSKTLFVNKKFEAMTPVPAYALISGFLPGSS